MFPGTCGLHGSRALTQGSSISDRKSQSAILAETKWEKDSLSFHGCSWLADVHRPPQMAFMASSNLSTVRICPPSFETQNPNSINTVREHSLLRALSSCVGPQLLAQYLKPEYQIIHVQPPIHSLYLKLMEPGIIWNSKLLGFRNTYIVDA